MTETTAKAGEYELIHPWNEPVKGEKGSFIKHKAGDIVKLDADNAERLVKGGAAAPKGTAARQAKERADAKAAEAKAAAEQADAEYKRLSSDARTAGKEA